MQAMRDAFFDGLFLAIKDDPNFYLLTGDTGAPSLDQFVDALGDRFINCGPAEQGMIGMAAGLAACGKKVVVYGIIPFVTLRCLEQIKLDVCAMNMPVAIAGVGAGYGYGNSGPTHHAVEDIAVMRALPNMTIECPSDNALAAKLAAMPTTGPRYIRLDRQVGENLSAETPDPIIGFRELRRGVDLLIVATGAMVGVAVQVAAILEQSFSVSVVDIYRLKPFNLHEFMHVGSRFCRIVTLEEHSHIGGLGSVIRDEYLCGGRGNIVALHIGTPDAFMRKPMKRLELWDAVALTPVKVAARISEWTGECYRRRV